MSIENLAAKIAYSEIPIDSDNNIDDRAVAAATVGNNLPSFGYDSWWSRARSSRSATAFVVALALFTDMLVYGVVVPILPKLIEDMGRDSSDLGFLVGCYAFGLLGTTPVFGMLSDRYGTRKTPMLIGLLGLATATALFAISREYWQVVLARIAQGISGGASWSIGLSMIADVYPKEQLGVAMGIVLSANTLGTLLGPPIGGVMYKYISYEAPFYFCAALALVDFMARLLVTPQPIKRIDSARQASKVETRLASTAYQSISTVPPTKVTMTSMLLDWSMLLMCLVTILVSTIYTAIEPTLPLYLKKVFGADSDMIGLIFTSIVIPNIFMSVVVGHLSDRYGRKLTSAFGVFLVALSAPLITLSDSYWLEVPALMLFGGTAAFAMTPILPDMAEYAESKCGGAYGMVYALFNMAYSIGMLIGPVLAGLLYEWIGFFWQMFFMSVFLICLVPFMVWAEYRGKSNFQTSLLRRNEEDQMIVLDSKTDY